ncbi:MAG: hypothetical protein ACSHX4_04830 [Opitutaceae bacterium]
MNEEKDRPWLRIHDDWGDLEGHISGNKQGLEALKKKIDQALDEGVGLMEDFDCDFNSVAVRETKEDDTRPDTVGIKLLKGGFLTIIATCLLIFGFGLLKLWEALTQ